MKEEVAEKQTGNCGERAGAEGNGRTEADKLEEVVRAVAWPIGETEKGNPEPRQIGSRTGLERD